MLDKVHPAAGHLPRLPAFGASAVAGEAGPPAKLEEAAAPAPGKPGRRANGRDMRTMNIEELKVTPSPAETGADRPTIALAMGDPAGVSPELTARLLADDEIRGGRPDRRLRRSPDPRRRRQGRRSRARHRRRRARAHCRDAGERPVLVDLGHLAPSAVRLGEATPEGGAFALENFRRALAMAQSGEADAVCFTPFNKKAMRYVYAGYDDEIRFVSRRHRLPRHGARIQRPRGPLERPRHLAHPARRRWRRRSRPSGILAELALADRCLRDAGFAHPRIAVAALNPHAGDGGNFGREEIEVIAPAVKAGVERGFNVSGPVSGRHRLRPRAARAPSTPC